MQYEILKREDSAMKRILFTIIAFVTLMAFTAPAIYAADEPAPTPTEPTSPPPSEPAPSPTPGY
jgi:hypothetical protein